VEWRDAVIYLRWLKVLGEVCFCLDAGFAVACIGFGFDMYMKSLSLIYNHHQAFSGFIFRYVCVRVLFAPRYHSTCALAASFPGLSFIV